MEAKNERNYGIDLLRILAMFFVIVLHCYGRGGILENTIVDSSQYKIAWFIEIIAYCAVDIFALVSGYVCYKEQNDKIKISRYLNLWCQVVFYGLVINLAFSLGGYANVNGYDYIITLFPVSNNLYWYFTAYTGVFLLMPLINNGIKNTDEHILIKIFILLFSFFSIYSLFFDVFALENGYSFIWILLLYIMGAIMKKCHIGENTKKWLAIIGIILLAISTYLFKMYGLTTKIITKDLLISYCSPTILGMAILYIIWFSKIKFNNVLKKIIAFASVSSFSIYIINNHFLVWDNVMNLLFKSIANGQIRYIIIKPLIFSVFFVIGAILIDKVRIIIFKILHMDNISRFIEKKFNNLFNKKEPLN